MQEKQESNLGNSKIGTFTGNFPRICHFGHRRAKTEVNYSFSKWRRRKKKSLEKQKSHNRCNEYRRNEIYESSDGQILRLAAKYDSVNKPFEGNCTWKFF